MGQTGGTIIPTQDLLLGWGFEGRREKSLGGGPARGQDGKENHPGKRKKGGERRRAQNAPLTIKSCGSFPKGEVQKTEESQGGKLKLKGNSEKDESRFSPKVLGRKDGRGKSLH